MSHPTSLRLPDEVRTRLNDESRRIASAPSSLAVVLIDEMYAPSTVANPSPPPGVHWP